MPAPPMLSVANMRRVISSIVDVIRPGLQWKDAPGGYGPHKTLPDRFVRWSRLSVVDRIFASLVAQAGVSRRADDRQHASRGTPVCCQPRPTRGSARCIGRTKGALNSKLHAVCDGQGRLVRLLLTAGQNSDHLGAVALSIPHGRALYRHRIANAFGRLKDWRRTATRYDRCAHSVSSAIAIAATVTLWLT